MGGIASEVPENAPQPTAFFPFHAKDIVFVTDDGIRLLSRHETGRKVVPNLSEEEIRSKSKANGIAKSLVCVQALWFIAQCITRRM